MAAGGLVGDDVITDLVRDRLAEADAAGGFVLDGYPRTASQAEALDTLRPPPSFMVLLIEVPGDAIVRRMSSRRVCESCAIRRLETHAEACGPVVEYYRPRPLFAEVDGLRHADAVTAAIMECVDRARRRSKE
jgi:adenylate kinase